jgi:hypothetical protein
LPLYPSDEIPEIGSRLSFCSKVVSISRKI